MFQPNLLKGKRVLITGGGTGLGKSMGRRMIELGAELMICGRRAQVLENSAIPAGQEVMSRAVAFAVTEDLKCYTIF
jgi:short-subunit dehydrogenase involved in D-alanine esterification of teichoic acids